MSGKQPASSLSEVKSVNKFFCGTEIVIRMAETASLENIAALNVSQSPGFTLQRDDTFGRFE